MLRNMLETKRRVLIGGKMFVYEIVQPSYISPIRFALKIGKIRINDENAERKRVVACNR